MKCKSILLIAILVTFSFVIIASTNICGNLFIACEQSAADMFMSGPVGCEACYVNALNNCITELNDCRDNIPVIGG